MRRECCQIENMYTITNIFLLDQANIGDLVCVNVSSSYYNTSIYYHNVLIIKVDEKNKSFEIFNSKKNTVKVIKTQQKHTDIYFNDTKRK
tara:strand:- start:280 stop:549 length:270 start_codon:yes stop_codon:yes gene_type:complete